MKFSMINLHYNLAVITDKINNGQQPSWLHDVMREIMALNDEKLQYNEMLYCAHGRNRVVMMCVM